MLPTTNLWILSGGNICHRGLRMVVQRPLCQNVRMSEDAKMSVSKVNQRTSDQPRCANCSLFPPRVKDKTPYLMPTAEEAKHPEEKKGKKRKGDKTYV